MFPSSKELTEILQMERNRLKPKKRSGMLARSYPFDRLPLPWDVQAVHLFLTVTRFGARLQSRRWLHWENSRGRSKKERDWQTSRFGDFSEQDALIWSWETDFLLKPGTNLEKLVIGLHKRFDEEAGLILPPESLHPPWSEFCQAVFSARPGKGHTFLFLYLQEEGWCWQAGKRPRGRGQSFRVEDSGHHRFFSDRPYRALPAIKLTPTSTPLSCWKALRNRLDGLRTELETERERKRLELDKQHRKRRRMLLKGLLDMRPGEAQLESLLHRLHKEWLGRRPHRTLPWQPRESDMETPVLLSPQEGHLPGRRGAIFSLWLSAVGVRWVLYTFDAGTERRPASGDLPVALASSPGPEELLPPAERLFAEESLCNDSRKLKQVARSLRKKLVQDMEIQLSDKTGSTLRSARGKPWSLSSGFEVE